MAMLTILTVCVCVDTVTADLTVILVAGVLGCVTLSSLEVTTNDSSGGVAFGAKKRRENKIHIRKINNYNQSRGTSKKPKLCNINTCSTQISHTQSLIGGCYQQLIVWCQVTEAKCLLCEEPFVRLLSAMVSAITWKTLCYWNPQAWSEWRVTAGVVGNPELVCITLYACCLTTPTSTFRLRNTNPQSLSLFRGVCALVHGALTKITVIYLAPRTVE